MAARLAARGARADLARAIGCSGATITTLLSPEARHSHLVPAIHRVFGWPPPELPDDSAEHEQDPARAELEALYDSLTREQIAVLAATARAFAGKK